VLLQLFKFILFSMILCAQHSSFLIKAYVVESSSAQRVSHYAADLVEERGSETADIPLRAGTNIPLKKRWNDKVQTRLTESQERHELSMGPISLLGSGILQFHTRSKAESVNYILKVDEFFLLKCIQQWGKKNTC